MSKRHILGEWLLPPTLIIVALLARLLPDARTVDDAYITFRYARNLLEWPRAAHSNSFYGWTT